MSKDGEFLGLYLLKQGVYFPVDTLSFPPQETDVSYGRSPNGTGSFLPLINPSFGLNNDGSSSIDEEVWNTNIDLYPNPTTKYVHVSTKDLTNLTAVSIFTSAGQQIYQRTCENCNEVKMDLNLIGLNSGLYFIEVKSEENHPIFLPLVYH